MCSCVGREGGGGALTVSNSALLFGLFPSDKHGSERVNFTVRFILACLASKHCINIITIITQFFCFFFITAIAIKTILNIHCLLFRVVSFVCCFFLGRWGYFRHIIKQ